MTMDPVRALEARLQPRGAAGDVGECVLDQGRLSWDAESVRWVPLAGDALHFDEHSRVHISRALPQPASWWRRILISLEPATLQVTISSQRTRLTLEAAHPDVVNAPLDRLAPSVNRGRTLDQDSLEAVLAMLFALGADVRAAPHPDWLAAETPRTPQRTLEPMFVDGARYTQDDDVVRIRGHFAEARPFAGALTAVRLADGTWNVIDQAGNVVLEGLAAVDDYRGDRAWVGWPSLHYPRGVRWERIDLHGRRRMNRWHQLVSLARNNGTNPIRWSKQSQFALVALIVMSVLTFSVLYSPARQACLSGDRVECGQLLRHDPQAAVEATRLVNIRADALAGALLAGADLTNADLAGADLRETDFEKARLVRANLDGATLTSTRLKTTNLNKASLRGAQLSGNRLIGVTLQAALLDGALLDGVRFDGGDLREASFAAVAMNNAEFRSIDGSEAVFDDAQLSSLHCVSCTLRFVSFRRAELQGAHFVDTDLQHANVVGADLSNARLVNTDIRYLEAWDLKGCPAKKGLPRGWRCVTPEQGYASVMLLGPRVTLTGAAFVDHSIDHLNFRQSRFKHVDFTEARFQAGTSFFNAKWEHVVMRKADLSQGDLRRATLEHVEAPGVVAQKTDFSAVLIRRSSFRGADFRRAKFAGGDIFDSNLQNTDLTHADLRGCGLWGVNLKGARLKHAKLKDARYDDKTVWPDGFDPRAAGARLTQRAIIISDRPAP